MENAVRKTRKIKKVEGHGGHHGGSWKVAYADFVTAMMAFFLLMWLITAKKAEDKVGMAEYFNEYNLIEGQAAIKQKIDEKVKQYRISIDQNSKNVLPIKPIFSNGAETTATQNIMLEWDKEVKLKLKDVADQIRVDVTDDNAISLQLVDQEGQLMFQSGSTEMSPTAKKILGVIWDKIKNEDVKIAIEGHTDAQRYSGSGKTNWELSTERASAARKELERLGFNPQNLIRVSGLADTRPISKDPFSPLNRRISLLFYYDLQTQRPFEKKMIK